MAPINGAVVVWEQLSFLPLSIGHWVIVKPTSPMSFIKIKGSLIPLDNNWYFDTVNDINLLM